MWSWYLEWNSIARAAIADRSLLRELGFLESRRAATAPEPVPAPVNNNPTADPTKTEAQTANNVNTPVAA